MATSKLALKSVETDGRQSPSVPRISFLSRVMTARSVVILFGNPAIKDYVTGEQQTTLRELSEYCGYEVISLVQLVPAPRQVFPDQDGLLALTAPKYKARLDMSKPVGVNIQAIITEDVISTAEVAMKCLQVERLDDLEQ